MNRINYSILVVAIGLGSCAYNDITDKISCDDTDLAIAVLSTVNATSCRSIDGSIMVSASGGSPAYDFSLNSGTYQTNPEFTGLASGSYEVIVKDILGCTKRTTVEITSPDTDLDATHVEISDSQCLTDNGAITITGQAGAAPYVYQLGTSGFSANNTFQNLKHGAYSVVVKDAEDCQKVINVTVPRANTGISFSGEIKTILDTDCTLSGCHDASSGSIDWTNIANVQARAAQIKTRTGNKTMPIGGRTLTQNQIDLIACWVDDGAPNN